MKQAVGLLFAATKEYPVNDFAEDLQRREFVFWQWLLSQDTCITRLVRQAQENQLIQSIQADPLRNSSDEILYWQVLVREEKEGEWYTERELSLRRETLCHILRHLETELNELWSTFQVRERAGLTLKEAKR